MKDTLTYGHIKLSVEDLRPILEEEFGLIFVGRDSSFIGEYYLSESETGEEFKITSNIDPVNEEVIWERFEGYLSLIHIYTARSEEIDKIIRAKIEDIVLLSSGVIPGVPDIMY